MDAVGRVRRVNGPLVEATGLASTMFELALLGPHRIPAETVAIANGTTTLQAYEYTGGLCVGDLVEPTGEPLSARLGPSLLGGVFDGLLRPLSSAPVRLTSTYRPPTAGEALVFTPTASIGQEVGPGSPLGTLAVPGALDFRILVPPSVSGAVTQMVGAGEVDDTTIIARVGETPIRTHELWPVRRPRPYVHRDDTVVPLHTGQRALDLLFPVGRGSATAVPGGFGTGKTVLLQQIAKWCDADVIVYIGCGERGNELADVLADFTELSDPRTGGRLIDRTVIIANTSNMPMMAREASVYTGITVAEYFRDMGHDAVVIADSTSRWAEALREFASRTGALPAEEGYPADLASALAAFYERAGRVRTLSGAMASVTVIGAVSPPGGDLTEPVTTATLRFVQAVWSLDKELAYSRHYPAVSWSDSFARQAEAIGALNALDGDPDWVRRRAETTALLADADRLHALAEVVGAATLPGRERVVMLAGRLIRDAVLMQSALSEADASSPPAKSTALLQAVLDVVAAAQGLVARGVSATVVERFDFGPLIRMRDEVHPDDVSAIEKRRDDVVHQLEGLANERD